MNSCRLGVHFWPTRVRKSIAYSHSPKVRSVLRTKSCSDFTSSSIRNLTRGSGVSSKLRTTAAVSSVSLNWGMVTVLRVTMEAQTYTSDRARVSTPRLEHGTLFGYQGRTPEGPEIVPMLAPPPASPESAGMSKPAFERIEAHLKHKYDDAGRFPGTQPRV